MGSTTTKLIIQNPRKPELQPLEVEALADTGSVFLCIPAHVQLQLGLEEVEKKEVTLADESTEWVSYVGPIELRFKNRTGFVGAASFSAIRFSSGTPIPMEDMDLVANSADAYRGRQSRESELRPRNREITHGNCLSRFTISIAARATSLPLLPALPPARSSACSSVSHVNTPNSTGTPVARFACRIPSVAALQT